MTNSKKLRDEITENGITREGFYKKLNKETEFKASEISALQKILNLSNEKRRWFLWKKSQEVSVCSCSIN